MNTQLAPEQIEIIIGNPAVNAEFTNKVQELDRRLQKNGMSYRQWDTLNDRQQDVFSNNLFLTPTCARSVNDYVDGAVSSCGCEDTEEELHHHSPALMFLIDKQRNTGPRVTMKVSQNELFDRQIDHMLSRLLESGEI